MGANGSKSLGTTENEEGRRWKTIEILPNGVKIIEFKNLKTPTKMPEESVIEEKERNKRTKICKRSGTSSYMTYAKRRREM